MDPFKLDRTQAKFLTELAGHVARHADALSGALFAFNQFREHIGPPADVEYSKRDAADPDNYDPDGDIQEWVISWNEELTAHELDMISDVEIIVENYPSKP